MHGLIWVDTLFIFEYLLDINTNILNTGIFGFFGVTNGFVLGLVQVLDKKWTCPLNRQETAEKSVVEGTLKVVSSGTYRGYSIRNRI